MLRVLTVPAFNDNYVWIIHNGHDAVVVDPGDCTPVRAALATHSLSLLAILLTHHHADHTGGVRGLVAQAAVPVYGPAGETIDGVTKQLREGEIVALPELELSLTVLDVPGHTRGHIAYVAQQYPWLFCGDTLFAGGCGRLFDGTPQQMQASLAKLAALPEATQVYCAHEYTLRNLQFALEVEPENAVLAERITRERRVREAGKPTLPTTIAIEKATNPFLRCEEPAIIKRLVAQGRIPKGDTASAFAALRAWKDVFP